MKLLLRAVFFVLVAVCVSAVQAQSVTVPLHPTTAQAMQSRDTIQRAVAEYLRVQTGSLPGQVTFSTGAIDPRLTLAACGALEVYTPFGSRLWGNSSVGVRCSAPIHWSIYVPIKVQITGAYVVTSRALPAGQVLTQADLAIMQGDLTQLPASVVTDAANAIGKTLGSPLPPAQAVRADLLRTPHSVLQGQNVKVVSEGQGFSVSAEGKAVTNAGVGQVAQVRLSSGQTVSGIARADGSVQINF
jgi:flagellar basal body P-ring formation protein FlgA